MTKTTFLKRETINSENTGLRRYLGLVWLAAWLMVAGNFGYRAITQEDPSEAVASIDHTTVEDAGPKFAKPIEQIQVGEKVAYAVNPTEGFDSSLGTKIHAHAWRKIELKPDEHSRDVTVRWRVDTGLRLATERSEQRSARSSQRRVGRFGGR